MGRVGDGIELPVRLGLAPGMILADAAATGTERAGLLNFAPLCV